jgi:colanic acid/amylovoran biosynthesis protein
VNKGAALMLYASLQKMREAYPDASFVMAPTHNSSVAPFSKRCELGFLQKAWLIKYGIQWGRFAEIVPRKLREAYGVVLDKEIDVVIDASGFSYSDQMDLDNTRVLAKSSKKWRKQGTIVILLPQAMGPFKSAKIKKMVNIIAENVNLMFPRDPISYKHLTEAVGERKNISMAPDFTNLLEGIIPDYFDPEIYGFCIVPNYRMIEKTTEEQSEAYIPFMIKIVKYLFEIGQKPFLLIHEGEKDAILARKISDGTHLELPIIQEPNPLKIKGIIGASYGALSSRYHGLISALSQGVPALGTGWSHKYKMLFHDYGFDEGLLNILDKEEDLRKKINIVTDPENHKKIQSKLNSKSNKIKKLSQDMWIRVFQVLQSSLTNR